MESTFLIIPLGREQLMAGLSQLPQEEIKQLLREIRQTLCRPQTTAERSQKYYLAHSKEIAQRRRERRGQQTE